MTDTDKIKQELPSQEEVDAALHTVRRIHDCVKRLSGKLSYATICCGYNSEPDIYISYTTFYGNNPSGTNLREMIDELFPSPEEATRMEVARLEREREELETKLKENTEALEALK